MTSDYSDQSSDKLAAHAAGTSPGGDTGSAVTSPHEDTRVSSQSDKPKKDKKKHKGKGAKGKKTGKNAKKGAKKSAKKGEAGKKGKERKKGKDGKKDADARTGGSKGNKKARKTGKSGRKGKGSKRNSAADSALAAAAIEAPEAARVSEFDDHLNRSLDDVISLLEQEIERLKTALETYRLTNHPERDRIIRWHVRTIDERQDTLEDLRSLLIAERQGNVLH